jgi:effector-binding domain-containing protein
MESKSAKKDIETKTHADGTNMETLYHGYPTRSPQASRQIVLCVPRSRLKIKYIGYYRNYTNI